MIKFLNKLKQEENSISSINEFFKIKDPKYGNLNFEFKIEETYRFEVYKLLVIVTSKKRTCRNAIIMGTKKDILFKVEDIIKKEELHEIINNSLQILFNYP